MKFKQESWASGGANLGLQVSIQEQCTSV